jgi:transposase
MGRPLRFLITGGEKADCRSAEALLEGQQASTVLADKGYDTNAIRSFIAAVGMQAVIPSKSSRKEPIPHDKELYKERNFIERCFGKLKKHRRIATRFDRNDSHYLGFLFLASSLLWLPS